MGDSAPLIGELRLNEVALPGTHGTGTFTIIGTSAIAPDNSSVFLTNLLPDLLAAWSKNQALSFTQQLNAGIRYFDIRVCSAPDGGLYFCHGFYGPGIA